MPAGPTSAALGRRQFLRGAAVGGMALLGGCGISGQRRPAAAVPDGAAVLDFSSWANYIDVDPNDPNRSPTLAEFTAETGIAVNHLQDINGYAEYFAKIRQPLAAGRAIGRDLTMVDNPLAARMIRLGWLQPFDHGRIPNLRNLLDALENPAHDPDRRFTIPWQTGFVGIAYNPAVTGRVVDSIDSLLAPDLAGRVTCVVEMRDTMGMMLLAQGSDPSDHSIQEFEAAIARLSGAVRAGQVRAFTGSEYAADLATGNIAASIAWSGSAFQAQLDNPDLRFVVPAEGGMRFTDNLVIPAGAAHKENAERFADFAYRPAVAARIAAYVNFITPVEGARDAMAAVNPALVRSEMIFPSGETLARTHEFMVLDEEQERTYQDLFEQVVLT